MSKKDVKRTNSTISEIISDIDIHLIEEIQVEEEREERITEAEICKKQEIEETLYKEEEQEEQRERQETRDSHIYQGKVSLDKIKQRAVAHAVNSIDEVQSTVNLQQVKRKKEEIKAKKGLSKIKLSAKLWISLVAILSLMGVIVAAVGQNNTLENFFGEIFPYKEQVQVVGTKQVKSGIIYTVEGAFIDNLSGLFIVSMRKEDGSPFEEGTTIGHISVRMEKPCAMGYSSESYFEDDNKKLVSVLNLSCDKPLYKKEIMLVAEDLMKETYETLEIPLNLNKLYEEDKFTTLRGNEENWYNYSVIDGLKLQPLENFKEFTIDDVRISEVGLSLLTSYPDVKGIQYRIVSLSATDIRTGKTYEAKRYSKWESETGLNKNSFVFEGIEVEDLPYLKLQLIDSHSKELIIQDWEVTFKLSKNSQVVSKRILYPIKVGEEKTLFTKVEVSALGVILKGYGNSDLLRGLDIAVIMKDGKEEKLHNSGSSSGLGGFTGHYDLGISDDGYMPHLITLDKVEGVRINDKIIKINSSKLR